MSQSELISTVVKLASINAALADLKDQAEALEGIVKNHMLSENIEQMDVAGYAISFKPVVSKRIDTKALKALFGEEALANYFLVTETRRFTMKADK